MYTRILTPLDGSDVSEQVLPYARAFAARMSLPLALLMAIEPEHPTIGQSLNPELHSHETEAHRAGHAESYLSSVAARVRGAGINAQITVPRGEPAGAIVGEAARDPGTLIAISSHGRSGFARWWMGSVADKVLHMSENPLLIVRSRSQAAAEPEEAPERLIVSLDGSDLAEEVLPHVVFVASTMGIPVDLVHVTLSESEYYQTMSMGLRVLPPRLPSFQSFSEGVEAAAEDYVARIKQGLELQGVRSVETRVLRGSPADRIVDLATEHPHSLIAMTTHGRSGLGRLMLGSVAERVVRHSGSPVLLVRATHREEIPVTGVPVTA